MKLHIRIDGRVQVVDHIVVDGTCLPLVAGAQPYDPQSRSSCPLVRQSAQWFKTLAVEAVYIDCNRRLIYWTPVFGANIQDVQVQTASNSQDFIPPTARTLFQDSSIYDFDASLKEMMLKCSTATHKFSRKFVSVDEYHKIIAKILHIYILPSIHFTREDIDSLLQVKCQIEERLTKVEEGIKAKAIVKENVKICLDKMMDKFLCEENLNSERYLRTCDQNFLTAALKVVECNIAALNTDLSAIQNMVNWVKEHPGDGQRLAQLKARRDQIFADVEQRIQVRETIKNVAIRRDLSKKKNNKCKVTKSCVHNMFMEVLKQFESYEYSMRELGDGKVSICAAREAILYTLSNITSTDQQSASSCQFEPDKLTSFSVDDGRTDKSICWLPLSERVAQTLENKKSVSYMCHEYGCQKLISRIVHIITDFQPTKVLPESTQSGVQTQFIQPAMMDVQPCDQHEGTPYDDMTCQFSLSLSEVTMRHPKLVPHADHKRKAIFLHEDSEWWKSGFQPPDFCAADLSATAGMLCDSRLSQESIHSSEVQTQVIQSSVVDVQPCNQQQVTAYDDVSSQSSLSLSEMTMKQPKLVTQAVHQRQAVFLCEDSEKWTNDFHLADICAAELVDLAGMSCDSGLSVDAATVSNGGVESVLARKVHGAQKRTRDSVQNCLPEEYVLVPGYRGTRCADAVFTEAESPGGFQQPSQRQMTLSVFTEAVEELKGQIQVHLTDVLELLGQEILGSESEDMTLKEQQELLWKSYDRFFCQELYTHLLHLYTAGLTPGVHQAYTELCNLSVLDILKGDKLLTLIFGPNILRGRASPIPISRPTRDMSAVSFSVVSRDFDDFSFGVDRCNSVGTEDSHDRGQKFWSQSSDFVNRSIDEGFSQASHSLSSSLHSRLSTDRLDDDEDDMWECPSSSRKIEGKLNLVLSPFMEFVGVCLSVHSFNEKIRYITKAIEGLNDSISDLYGLNFKSTCDDILSMLVLVLCNIPEDIFVSLYVNLRLLMDVLPDFFFGSRWDFNLVSLYSAYNYLFTLKISGHVVYQL